MRLRPGFLATSCLGALLSCSSSPAPDGGPQSTRALAAEAVHAAFENGAFEAMREQAIASAFSVAKARIEGSGRTLTTEQSGRLEAVLRKVLGEVYPRTAWEDALLPLYLDAFDRKELERVVEFQRTPLGSKILAVQARLVTGGATIGDRLMKSRQAEFTKRLGEELNQAWKAPP